MRRTVVRPVSTGTEMGTLLRHSDTSSCSLCGSRSQLTREHKIKASALRSQFGADGVLVGSSHQPVTGMRTAQSVGSDHLKFKNRICAQCNSARTQPADLEFDRFLERLLGLGGDPSRVFALERYARDTPEYLNVFRYFAKLLCCHLSEIGAPIFQRLALFAIGQAHENCIWLDIKDDGDFLKMRAIGLESYAAHGGLTAICDRKTGEPTRLVSSVTVGPLQFEFFTVISPAERLEIRLEHPQFVDACRAAVAEG